MLTMMLNRTAVSSLFSLSFYAMVVLADISAFSGTACDGDVGADVACDGSCHSFSGRHSFKASFEGAAVQHLNFSVLLTNAMTFFRFKGDCLRLTLRDRISKCWL
jgi:hypothetical protein